MTFIQCFHENHGGHVVSQGGQTHGVAIQSISTAETSEVKSYSGKAVESKYVSCQLRYCDLIKCSMSMSGIFWEHCILIFFLLCADGGGEEGAMFYL